MNKMIRGNPHLTGNQTNPLRQVFGLLFDDLGTGACNNFGTGDINLEGLCLLFYFHMPLGQSSLTPMVFCLLCLLLIVIMNRLCIWKKITVSYSISVSPHTNTFDIGIFSLENSLETIPNVVMVTLLREHVTQHPENS